MTRQSDSGGVAASAAPDCSATGEEYMRRCREASAKFTRMPAAQLAKQLGAFASVIHRKGIIVSPEVMALLTVCEFRLSPPNKEMRGDSSPQSAC